ncbi:MAG: hypothetical protein AAFV53_42865 [Myxococcota bacterium]
MLESAAVIAVSGEVLYWHLPARRTVAALPDSRTLWEILWAHRDHLAGVAHTHPGAGLPAPSWTDLTTFAACEDGLGERLIWWIATPDHLAAFTHHGPNRLDYAGRFIHSPPPWLSLLRRHSNIIDHTKRSAR